MPRRVVIVQPSVPAYRKHLFELLAGRFDTVLLASDVSIDGASSDAGNFRATLKLLPVRFFAQRFAWQSGLVSYVRRQPIDALVLSGNPRYLSTVAALVVARVRRIPVYWWSHAASSPRRGAGTWLRFQCMRLARGILLYYPEERRRLPAYLAAKSVGIDNTVDTAAIREAQASITESDIDAFGNAHGLDDRPLLLTIGRLTPKARTGLLLAGLAEMRKRGIHARLAVLGGGDRLAELQQKARELGVSGSVLWAGPVFVERDVALWMRHAAVFVYGGAVGLSLVHAFAYGLPAVISDDSEDHSPEALVFCDGVHGKRFRAGSPESIANSLADVLASAANLRQMSSEVVKLVQDRLNVEAMADNFCAALDDRRPAAK